MPSSRRRRAPLALPCLLALLAAAPAAAQERVSYALIVANNASLDPARPALRYADDDGARYYELFAPRTREALLLSVLDDDTQRHHPGLAARTRPPTRAAMEEALAHLHARMREDRAQGKSPELFFVFTGHGQRGAAGEGSVTLLDGAFTRTDLFAQVIAPSPASLLHLIVDACDSYFFVNARGGLPVGPSQGAAVTAHLQSRDLARYPQVGAVLSTTREQESHEWSALRAGVFSHQVRSALAGAADVNGDGRVEYSELRAFIAAANQGVEDVRGRLDVFTQAPAIDLTAPLADLRREGRQAFLLLPAGLEGRLWVEDGRGVRVADVNKERERPLVLALSPDQPYYLRGAGREAPFRFPGPGAVVDARGLSWNESALAARGPVQDAFRERLFSVPFGPRFYAGFMSGQPEAPVSFAELGPDLSP